MKTHITILAIICIIAFGTFLYGDTQDAHLLVKDIDWMGHDSFMIRGEKVIYTDPFKIKDGTEKADIILITHDHYDHCSPEDVKKIQAPHTVIVTTSACASKLHGNVRVVKPGDTLNVEGISIEAVPAYNVNKKFHPKERGDVGYIFTVKGQRIYLAGDTDHIPEMKTFRNIAVALLPVSGTYVMTAEEAAQAALDIKPSIAIPMHYGRIIGTKMNAEVFAEALKGKVEVIILNEE